MYGQASYEEQVPQSLMPYYMTAFQPGEGSLGPGNWSEGWGGGIWKGSDFGQLPLGLSGTTWMMLLAAAGGVWYFGMRKKRR